MGWLQSISFTKSSSMKSSSRSSTSSSPVSFDEIYPTSTSSRNNDHHHHHRRHRQRVSSGGLKIHAPRFTRDRRSRHSTDQDVESESCSPKSTTSTAVPLPLPLPVPEGGEADYRLPSPKENIDRDYVRALEERGRGEERERASPYAAIKSVFSGKEPRKLTEPLETRSSRKVHRYLNAVGSSQDDSMINGPISAPTSPFGSPVLSPQRKSTPDLFPISHMLPGGRNLGWSAPEMSNYEIAGLPPPAFFDYTAFSTDSSPLHSPNRSPRGNPKSPSGPASPLHVKLSHETSTTRRESNGQLSIQRESSGQFNAHRESNGPFNAHRESNNHINVHPLPLPPGAAMPAPSPTPIPQVTPKSDLLPMNNQWQKGKLIGRGTFGSVYVASNRETGALCAMKEVEIFPDDPKSAECIKQLEQEIKVLSQLKHPNIVQYYGSEIVDDKFYIYLEYVHPGSINKYTREHCGAITESVIRNFTRHILSGLAYLHSTKTVHRDIKGANLLVDACGVVKLADFGMAKHLTGQRADLSLKGSPYWMAPELMQAVMQKDNSSDLAFAVDIWSLGCTIIEMFNGKPPWSEYEGAAAMFKVMRDTPPIPETLSPEGKDFLRCCFRRNPAERPTATTLLEHRFLRGSVPLDVSSCTQSFNGMKLMDKPRSPRRRDIILDQLPALPSSRSTTKVAPDSEGHRSHHEAPEFAVATRISPRSTLEGFPSLSVQSSGHSTHHSSPSPTTNGHGTLRNHMIK